MSQGPEDISYSKSLKKKTNPNPVILFPGKLFPGKLSFKNEGEMKTLPDFKKRRKVVASRSTL